jgi:hypothetical protein
LAATEETCVSSKTVKCLNMDSSGHWIAILVVFDSGRADTEGLKVEAASRYDISEHLKVLESWSDFSCCTILDGNPMIIYGEGVGPHPLFQLTGNRV